MCQKPVFFCEIANPKSGDRLSSVVEKNGWVLEVGTSFEILADGLYGLVPKWNDALLVTFANERNLEGFLQTKICDQEVGDLRNSSPDIVEQEEQGVIAKI